MKYIYRILILGIILTLSSCEFSDTVYEDIPSSKFPETEAQRNSIKEGAYGEQRHLLDDGGFWLYAQETTSDVLVFPQRGTDWEDGGKWRVMNRHTWTSDDQVVENMWGKIYPVITRCNQSIDLINGGIPGPDADMAIAEMEVVRSYMYYLLIDNYGAVPYVISFSDADPSPMRNTRESICDALIQTVLNAISILPNATDVAKSVVSKDMAHVLLGKLYLNRKIYSGATTFSASDMDSVIYHMSKVIDSEFSLETDRLAPFAVNNTTSSENIYSIQSSKTSDDGMRLNFRTLHTLNQQTYDLESTPWNGCAMKPDFYQNLFAANDGFSDADDITSINDEVVDLRAAGVFKGQQFDMTGAPLANDNGSLIYYNEIKADIMTEGVDYTNIDIRFSGYRIGKYEVEIGGGPIMNNDFPVFRLADVYLMRSEAILRGGSGTSADADLNMIRSQAGLPDVTASLQEVLDERGRELYLEGHRRSDLIRFGKFASRNWWLGADDSDPGVERRTFPLPQSQVEINPNLSLEPVSVQ